MFLSQIYDNHTLFVKCGVNKAEFIKELFCDALSLFNLDKDVKTNCDFHVNLVENRDGVSFGIGFVFVTNPTVYYMFLGKNPDGTDRIKYIDDLNWTKPEEIEVKEVVYPPGISWAELDEIDRNFDLQRKKFICPKIEVLLEPLISLEVNSDDPVEQITIGRACAPNLEDKFMPNILKSRNVPDFITEKQIKDVFRLYATDNITKHLRVINGKRREDTYPFVNINRNRVVFVTFDPSTNDAAFALHLLKKVAVTNGRSSITLLFGNSYRLDKDMDRKVNDNRQVYRKKNVPK